MKQGAGQLFLLHFMQKDNKFEQRTWILCYIMTNLKNVYHKKQWLLSNDGSEVNEDLIQNLFLWLQAPFFYMQDWTCCSMEKSLEVWEN